MKRKIILSICALLLAAGFCASSAMAWGGERTPRPDGTPQPVTYDHVDVRTTGKIELTVGETKTEYDLTVTSVRVLVGRRELTMSGPKKSESKIYPFEFQSQRGLEIKEGAKIQVICAFSYRTGREKAKTGAGTFEFTTADTNCEAETKGVDLTITAALIEEAVATPTPVITPTPTPVITPTPTPVITPTPTPVITPTPTPVITPTPTPVITPTPTPVITPTPTPTVRPTPTPTRILPQTGETADMWTVMLVLTGLCAVTGAVLLLLRRANRE